LWYGVYGKDSGIIEYASGGHPGALLIREGADGARRVERLSKGGMVVGGMPGSIYQSGRAEVEAGARLLVFSDGVYEILMENGQTWDEDGFMAYVEQELEPGPGALDRILEHGRKLGGGQKFEDDYSILELEWR
jgi:sigma-B regulation protein RsbU (phosphoserine phosphatase)